MGFDFRVLFWVLILGFCFGLSYSMHIKYGKNSDVNGNSDGGKTGVSKNHFPLHNVHQNHQRNSIFHVIDWDPEFWPPLEVDRMVYFF